MNKKRKPNNIDNNTTAEQKENAKLFYLANLSSNMSMIPLQAYVSESLDMKEKKRIIRRQMGECALERQIGHTKTAATINCSFGLLKAEYRFTPVFIHCKCFAFLFISFGWSIIFGRRVRPTTSRFSWCLCARCRIHMWFHSMQTKGM